MEDTLLTSTHWGVYDVHVEDGRVARILPFDKDPDPSPIGQSLVDGVTAPARIRRPAVRKGYLESGPASRDKRGAEF